MQNIQPFPEHQLFPKKKELESKKTPKCSTVKLVSNHFNIKIDKSVKFYEFQIKIFDSETDEPDLNTSQDDIPQDSRQKRKEILEKFSTVLQKTLKFYVITGNQLFTTKKSKMNLDFKIKDFQLFLIPRGSEMTFKDIDSSMKEKQPLLRLINSYFKNVLDSQNMIELGNNKQYYNP